jgi:peptidoglycan/xylan/chitin deacetylase (PgdA/CDA1 family)
VIQSTKIMFLLWLMCGAVLALLAAYWYKMKIAKYILKKYKIVWDSGKNGSIALTIDDVIWSEQSFTQILDILERKNVSATFFVISSLVNDKNIHLLIKAVKSGHHLANHGKTNCCHANLSPSALHEEIFHCEKLIINIYEKAKTCMPLSSYYRPGCGYVNKHISSYCKKHGYKIILGSNYPSDPFIRIGIINKMYVLYHLQKNDIIILHDRQWTADILEELITEILRRGHKITNIDTRDYNPRYVIYSSDSDESD